MGSRELLSIPSNDTPDRTKNEDTKNISPGQTDSMFYDSKYDRRKNDVNVAFKYSWIGSPVDANKKTNPSKNQMGYIRQSRDHIQKALAENNPDLLCILLCEICAAELDDPRQILLCRGLRVFWGALVVRKIMFNKSIRSQAVVCAFDMCDN